MLFMASCCFFSSAAVWAKSFTVVIDAGHGGKDPGTRGSILNEKDINLSVALELGRLIQENNPDVKIVYTRKTDVFIELDERANIANRCKADLFISIHTNAQENGHSVCGTEVYSLGLARTNENLAVAKRENSVILLEDNYMQTYEGFDPNSTESYIIFEFIQNKHMEQSVKLAQSVQKYFTSIGRVDRGVRQAGFLVLRKTGMPSILVELGFITNPNEQNFMASKSNRFKLATAIYNAFAKYKWEYDRKTSGLVIAAPKDIQAETDEEETTNEESSATISDKSSENDNNPKQNQRPIVKDRESKNVSVNNATKGQLIYKVQILSSDKKLSSKSKELKGYKNVDCFKERGLYKYTIGETTNFEEIKKLRRSAANDFKDAFITAFKDGKRVNY